MYKISLKFCAIIPDLEFQFNTQEEYYFDWLLFYKYLAALNLN